MNNKLKNQTLSEVIMSFAALICLCAANVQAQTSSSVRKGITYRNPRVYNIEYSFEMFPDPNKIDRSKDLKLWVPIPREWDSQKAVKIISVQPEPHAKYVDPEYGNLMLFWDFGKEPERPSYKVHMKYRSEQYDVHSNIDPNLIGAYDKTSKDYILYTRSTNTVTITDEVRKLAKTAVGDEKNPYLQAKKIYELVRERMCYRRPDVQGKIRSRSVETILDRPVIDPKTGKEYYLGVCTDQSMVFVALCRAVGIPARRVIALWDNCPWIRTTPENTEPAVDFREQSIQGLAVAHRLGLGGHAWVEIDLPNYGWIPVDPTFGRVGCSNVNNRAVIITKGSDIQIDPNAGHKRNGGYREIGGHLCDGRAGFLSGGVFHASTIQRVKLEYFHHPDPFPADTLAEYMAMLYPQAEAEKNLALYRKRTLRWLDQNTREDTDKNAALAQAYKKEPRARYEHAAFICHMLRKIVGNKKFSDIFETYTNLRVKSGEPVSNAHFQKIAEDIYGQPLDWFFKQWVGYTELPQLQLDSITFSENEKGWHIRGNLRQLNESLFRLPVELAIETEKTTERKIIWLENRNTEFEFCTTNRPKSVLFDPNNNILQIRKMSPLLENPSYDEVAYCVITDQDKADWYDWTPLHFAAEAGQTDIVEYLIERGANVNAENIKGETPLQFAADKGYKEIVELLIEKGADFSIHLAVRLGDLAGIKRLIEDGADVNAKDIGGETPLHIAAAKGHKEVAELLIAKGADVDGKDSSAYVPLSWAVWNGDRDMIKLLVTNGADVNLTPNDDWTFLRYLAWENDKELVELLIAHGARLDLKDGDGWTAFRCAVSRGHQDLAEFFVSKGATAPEFHLVACLGNLDRVKSLVEEGMDVNTKDELGWTPLFWAASTGQEEVAEFLISKAAGVNVRTKKNLTPLHQAAGAGAARLVELLISKGADSNARDKNDSTPLHSAAEGGHTDIVEFLIAKGAEVKAKEKSGNTPLHYATAVGNPAIVQLLIAKGADVNAAAKAGTPLHRAAANGHANIVEILLAKGAETNAKDRRGRTALDLAKDKGHTEIAELLLNFIDISLDTQVR